MALGCDEVLDSSAEQIQSERRSEDWIRACQYPVKRPTAAVMDRTSEPSSHIFFHRLQHVGHEVIHYSLEVVVVAARRMPLVLYATLESSLESTWIRGFTEDTCVMQGASPDLTNVMRQSTVGRIPGPAPQLETVPYNRTVIEAGNACREGLDDPGPGSVSGAPSTKNDLHLVRPGPEVVSGVVWPTSVRVRDNGG
ncbi:hypothetical protein BC826DRAFT_972917 [Russula brevipes]|nr:hypothetical protein BC826DRAFT_972917 [Russula brevipes]